MKKLLKSLFLSSLLVCSLAFTSCSSFFEEDMTGYTIKEATAEILSNGDTKVTITYVNEDQEPLEFVVPKGQEGVKGKDGTGIEEIKIEQVENSSDQKITIFYTDTSKEPVSYVVPSVVSITEVTSSYDEITQKTMLTIHYSDGTSSSPIALPSGKDGNMIEDITSQINDDNSVTLKVYLTDSGDEPISINIPSPKDGRGIDYMESYISGNDYVLNIYYNDGTNEEITFLRPTKWFSESRNPTQDDGIEGDLWLNTKTMIVFNKKEGVWIGIINLSQTNEKSTVEFIDEDTSVSIIIESGKNFVSSGNKVPVINKEGYVFKGWYTSKELNPTIGCFTDLTPVYNDLTLYAIWEKIETK